MSIQPASGFFWLSVRRCSVIALLGLAALPACGKKKTASELATTLKERLVQKTTEVARANLGARAERPNQPDRDDPPPALSAASFAFQPSFATSDGQDFQAGKMVIARVPSAPGGLLGLSCIHIFGPDGGLARQIGSTDLPAFVKKTTLIAHDGGRIEMGAAFAVPGARPFSHGRGLPDASTDLSLFRAPSELATHALELASDDPAAGDRVWLLARVAGGAAPDVFLHPAHVRLANDQILVYEFENNQLNLTATSGAPVVNAQGKIVALNLGGGLTGGKLNVFGNPISSVRKKIEATLHATN